MGLLSIASCIVPHMHAGHRTCMHTTMHIYRKCSGIIFFRNTKGTKALLQAWRLRMIKDQHVPMINDQTVFNTLVKRARLVQIKANSSEEEEFLSNVRMRGLVSTDTVVTAMATRGDHVRGVFLSQTRFSPCLAGMTCNHGHVRFSLATLPMRAFANGHSWFSQRLQHLPDSVQPEKRPVAVHFTFQFGDTNKYPLGKRQHAREAGANEFCQREKVRVVSRGDAH